MLIEVQRGYLSLTVIQVICLRSLFIKISSVSNIKSKVKKIQIKKITQTKNEFACKINTFNLMSINNNDEKLKICPQREKNTFMQKYVHSIILFKNGVIQCVEYK